MLGIKTGTWPRHTAAMSERNVEIVKKVMQLFNLAAQGKPTPELLELFATDVVIDMTRRVFNPDIYEGHDGLRRLGREVGEVWGEFHVEPERFIDSGRRVVVIETRRARGRESDAGARMRSGVIWTLQDGKVVRMETDLDPNEALKAAGQTE